MLEVGMFTILFTAIGRRVELVKAFQASFEQKNIAARILGTDSQPQLASAGYFVDEVFAVSPVNEVGYFESLLEICLEQQVDVLIPLFEPEFAILDGHRQAFLNAGTVVLLSNQKALQICSNKFHTYAFFTGLEVKTPATWLASHFSEDIPFPLFVKPCSGMGSQGAKKLFLLWN
jgi:carbamoyl-phosphate synthase large subunit